MAEAVSTFISYSRTDSDFVDRLEADLRARGFNTWVDRRKLEGTREWQLQIDHAIEQYPLMIVVVSPDALKSEFVQHEYEYAHQLGDKRFVPVLCQRIAVPLPSELGKVQWVDFVDRPYESALVELIDGCQDPSFDQASDPRTLYNQAHDLESTDPERATILYQRLINRAPTYAGGRAQVDLDRLNQQLYPQRARRLRDQAETARKDGQYGAEAGALKALIALGSQDLTLFAWAKEYLPIAEQNSAWLDTYENVKHCIEVDDKERARELLTDLWRKEHAPFFRDLVGVAPALGLEVPITYEQDKERRLAKEASERRESMAAEERRRAGETKVGRELQAKRERDGAVAHAEQERDGAIGRADEDSQKETRQIEANWSEAQSLMQGDLSAITAEDLARRLGRLDALPSGNITVERIQDLTQTWHQHQSASNAIASAQTKVSSGSYYSILVGLLALCSGAATIAAICTAAYAMAEAGSFIAMNSAFDTTMGWTSTGVFASVAALLLYLTITVRRLSPKQRALKSARQNADESTKKAQRLYQEWLQDAIPLHQNRLWDAELLHRKRLQQIREQSQRAISEAERHHQQTMTEIAAEHARALADIAARYAGG